MKLTKKPKLLELTENSGLMIKTPAFTYYVIIYMHIFTRRSTSTKIHKDISKMWILWEFKRVRMACGSHYRLFQMELF